MSTKQISILGCGWLGLPLAIHLQSNGYQVKGSARTDDKLDQLKSKGIDAYKIVVDGAALTGDLKGFFTSDTLYLNIPPGRRRENVAHLYPQEINQIIKTAIKYGVGKVIFISSTGVYADSDEIVSENSPCTPVTSSGKALIAAEDIVKECGLSWTILRFAGLAGPDRNPAKWFAGKTDIPFGLNPVNMVHLDDCINISERVLSEDFPGEVLNVCADEHPSKQDFYTAQSLKSGVTPPKFKLNKGAYKIVSNSKVKSLLDYSFIHQDPKQF